MRTINFTDIGRLDFNLAVTFLALWRERSVSKAAAHLSLSQSAVSSALARLRAATDDPLFVRSQGGMRPTPRAIAMAAGIEQGIGLLHDALRMQSDFVPSTSKRHFTLGMSDDFEIAIGPRLSRAVLEQAPGISLVFRQTNRHTVEAMLGAGEIDIAVTAGLSERTRLDIEEIGRSGYACLLDAPQFDIALPLSLEPYLALPHILISYSGREGIVDTALRSIGRDRRIQTALTHFSAVPAYLKEMRAVATLPSHAAHALAADHALAVSPPPIDLGDYSVTSSCRRDMAADPAILWLRRQIKTVFKGDDVSI
jgi:DNA-binding transcriptional LysR family regulator